MSFDTQVHMGYSYVLMNLNVILNFALEDSIMEGLGDDAATVKAIILTKFLFS